MKLRIDQLGAQLKKQLAPVYIISGDEPLQIAQCCDQIRQHARAVGFSERHVFHVDNSFDWGDFLSTANSLSLFAQQQILELRMPSGKPGDPGSKALLEYISHPSPDNLLLMITDRLDNTQQNAKWFKALERVGVFIPIWPVESAQLPGWLGQRLQGDGYRATPQALTLISERVEGNMLAAAQELEKLKLLAKDKVIDEVTVEEAVSDSARFDVFQLIDTALNGNIRQCVRILSVLKGEGVETPIILWALAREIRLLGHLSRQISRGVAMDLALDQSAKIMGFAPFMLKRRKALLNKALQRNSERSLRQMLHDAGKIDRSIKGLDRDNTWDQLLSLVLHLGGLPPMSGLAV